MRGVARTIASIALGAAAVTLWPGASPTTTLEAPGPLGPLQGTLLASEAANAPVVLIIPGSGPTDRDGDNPLGVKAAPYRLIAEGLLAAGISSVRVDKRGMFGSAHAVADPDAVTISDYAIDVGIWVSAIRRKTGRDCVWALGHSEGGLVVLAAAQKVPHLCGLLLVSTVGRPLADVLREQLKAHADDDARLAKALAILDRLEAGQRVDGAGIDAALLPLFRPEVQAFMIDEFSYDPAKLIGAYHGPVLILEGERDSQVGAIDARRLHEANPRSTLTLLPDANHVLKSVPADNSAADQAAYANPNLPLADGVLKALIAFIRANGEGAK